MCGHLRRRWLSGANDWSDRSHSCGALGMEHVGQKVSLAGWIQFVRMNRFLVLRDRYGLTQLLIDDPGIWKRLDKLPLESVIRVEGLVQARPEGQANPALGPTGDIEVHVEDLADCSPARSNLPFLPRDDDLRKSQTNEALQMQFRYLGLRSRRLQQNLKLRSDLLMKMREFLIGHGFLDIDTPCLFRR